MLFSYFVTLFGCSSSLYVVEAGFEEVRILAKREKITDLISSSKFTDEVNAKLFFVSEARKFSSSIGLEPNLSFTTYTDVGRDVLVWVLAACSKTSLDAYTWWFPVVGRVSYMGYFDKSDAMEQVENFRLHGYDYYLRSSPAFSTLGWFDDPLLSTLATLPTHLLIETVMHEIVHNTIWVKDNVEFNETLASFVGARSAIDFFAKGSICNDVDYCKICDNDFRKFANILSEEWHDSLIYGSYIISTYYKLKAAFDNLESERNESGIDEADYLRIAMSERRRVYAEAAKDWESRKSLLISERYGRLRPIENNAVLLAHKAYYFRPEVFECFYQRLGRNLPRLVAEIKDIVAKVSSDEEDLFDLVEMRMATLPRLECKFAERDPVFFGVSEYCTCV